MTDEEFDALADAVIARIDEVVHSSTARQAIRDALAKTLPPHPDDVILSPEEAASLDVGLRAIERGLRP